MRRYELREMIAEGESSTVEFKRKFTSPEKIAKELIAFANSSGGYLIIGVDDNRTIIGVESEKETEELIDFACQFRISPPLAPLLEIVHVESKDVIVVFVPESEQKPHRLALSDDEKEHQRSAYIRHGEKTLRASREVEKILKSQNHDSEPVTLSIGAHERRLFDYLERHGRITVKEFARLANISERRAARLLVRLVRISLVHIHTEEQSDYYTLAGV